MNRYNEEDDARYHLERIRKLDIPEINETMDVCTDMSASETLTIVKNHIPLFDFESMNESPCTNLQLCSEKNIYSGKYFYPSEACKNYNEAETPEGIIATYIMAYVTPAPMLCQWRNTCFFAASISLLSSIKPLTIYCRRLSEFLLNYKYHDDPLYAGYLEFIKSKHPEIGEFSSYLDRDRIKKRENEFKEYIKHIKLVADLIHNPSYLYNCDEDRTKSILNRFKFDYGDEDDAVVLIGEIFNDLKIHYATIDNHSIDLPELQITEHLCFIRKTGPRPSYLLYYPDNYMLRENIYNYSLVGILYHATGGKLGTIDFSNWRDITFDTYKICKDDHNRICIKSEDNVYCYLCEFENNIWAYTMINGKECWPDIRSNTPSWIYDNKRINEGTYRQMCSEYRQNPIYYNNECFYQPSFAFKISDDNGKYTIQFSFLGPGSSGHYVTYFPKHKLLHDSMSESYDGEWFKYKRTLFPSNDNRIYRPRLLLYYDTEELVRQE